VVVALLLWWLLRVTFPLILPLSTHLTVPFHEFHSFPLVHLFLVARHCHFSISISTCKQKSKKKLQKRTQSVWMTNKDSCLTPTYHSHLSTLGSHSGLFRYDLFVLLTIRRSFACPLAIPLSTHWLLCCCCGGCCKLPFDSSCPFPLILPSPCLFHSFAFVALH